MFNMKRICVIVGLFALAGCQAQESVMNTSAFKTESTVGVSQSLFGVDALGSGCSQYAGPTDAQHLWSLTIEEDSHLSDPIVRSDGAVLIGSYTGELHFVTTEGKRGLAIFEDEDPSIAGIDWVPMNPHEYSQQHGIYLVSSNGRVVATKKIGLVLATPAIHEDIVYVGTLAGDIIAIGMNQESLNVIWRLNIAATIVAPLNVDTDGSVCIAASDGFVYMVDKSGKIKWVYDVEDFVMASPLIDDEGRVYVRTLHGSIVVIDENGTRLYRYSYSETRAENRILVADKDGKCLYVGYSTAELLADDAAYEVSAIKRRGGGVMWTHGGLGSTPAMAIDREGNSRIVSASGELLSLDSHGTFRWKVMLARGQELSPPIIDVNGRSYVGTANGHFFCVSLLGIVQWHVGVDGSLHTTRPAIGRDGVVFSASHDGILHAFGDNK